MSWTRAVIIAPPVALAMLGAASFVSVKSGPVTSRNELSIAIPGEPDTLNPILFTTQVANNVCRLLFDGLLRFDENLELAPGLAKSWEQGQTSTIFFRSSEAAQRAALALEAVRDRWPEWRLRAAHAAGSEVRLSLEQPGTAASRAIFNLVDRPATQPLTTLRLDPIPDDLVSRSTLVRRSWRDGSRAMELTFAASQPEAIQELARLAGAGAAERAKKIGEMDYLDEPEIVFHLRDNVLWHDGAPFSADDVAFTYRAIVDDATASPRRADYSLVSAVEAIDSRTVRARYRKPSSFALNSWTIGILPAHLLRDRPPASWNASFNRQPIGTGPFRFAHWKSNEQLALTRNDTYFQGTPHVPRIVYRIIPDRLSMRIAFETDQVDVWELDPYSAAQLENDRRFELLRGTALEYHFIGWNLRKPWLQDRRVRHALTHAIDIDAIIRSVIYNRGTRATGPFVPSMWFFNADIAPLRYDPGRAQQLLADAGWRPDFDGILMKDGERFRIELVTNNDNQTRKDIAVLTQRYLRRVGIEVNIRSFEAAVFVSQFVHQRAFDGLLLSWALRNDPDQFPIWHSSEAGPGHFNIAGYHDARVDELLGLMRVEYDRARIKELAAEFQAKIYGDQPYTFLYVPLNTAAVRRGRFSSMRPRPDGGWDEHPVQMTKAGLEPQWFRRVRR